MLYTCAEVAHARFAHRRTLLGILAASLLVGLPATVRADAGGPTKIGADAHGLARIDPDAADATELSDGGDAAKVAADEVRRNSLAGGSPVADTEQGEDAARGHATEFGGSAADAGVDAEAGDAIAIPISDAAGDVTTEDAVSAADAESSTTITFGDAQLPPELEKPETPPPPEQKARAVIAVVLGLLGLLVLAYVMSHRRVRAWEERIGVRSAITAGFPFVALGAIARHPGVGVLSEDVLVQLTPIFHFGLGWLGFLVGFQLEPKKLDGIPRGAKLPIIAEALCAFAVIAVACGALMLALGRPWRDATFLRDGLVLATAGAMASPTSRRSLLAVSDQPRWRQLDEVVGVLGLAALAAYFRPRDLSADWALPGTAWLFMTAGMGVTVGALVYLMLRSANNTAEFMAITLGSVALAAGTAAEVRLSPITVCFFTGLVVASFMSSQRQAMAEVLAQLERPIHLVFLAIVGALWNPADWRGWVLMAVFVAARLAGLAIGRRVAPGRAGGGFLANAPLSVLSIAVVVNAQALYQGRAVPWLVTAVIGGAIATEVVAQLGDPTPPATPRQDSQAESDSADRAAEKSGS